MSAELTDADIAAIREREAAATKAPWTVDKGRVRGPFATLADMRYKNGDADAIFITTIRNAAPALLTELTRLKAECERLRSRAATV